MLNPEDPRSLIYSAQIYEKRGDRTYALGLINFVLTEMKDSEELKEFGDLSDFYQQLKR